jgi:energy-dependent translational throttle protein EttA
MITGQEQPDAGTLKVGATVELAYVDQSRDALDPDKSVWEEISGGRTRSSWAAARGQLARLLRLVRLQGRRPAEEGRRAVRRRAQPRPPGQAAARGGNLILLDEPTNDLDVDTLRALEEALLNFAGCAVVISHDRWFLDRIATHMLAFEGESQVVWFEGNYQEYEADRRAAWAPRPISRTASGTAS